jgi:prepilin-type processing-associated H-X9-DG protein
MRDLIVLLVILFVAVGLILPAVQQPRINSNRIRCKNNIRQLAFACQNASDVFGSMPPYDCRVMPTTNPYSNQGGNYGSVHFGLLPFVEQVRLYNSAQFPGQDGKSYAVSVIMGSGSVPVNCSPGPPQRFTDYVASPPAPELVLKEVVKVFVCPSDVSADVNDSICPNGWAGTSYGCNFLVFANPLPESIDDPDGVGGTGTTGAWGFKAVLPESFPAGTQYTVLFAEKYVACGDGLPAGANSAGSAWAWANHSSRYAPAVAIENPWNDGTKFQTQPTPDQCDWRYAQTGHPDGMNAVMADGSARVVAASIDAGLYQGLFRIKEP